MARLLIDGAAAKLTTAQILPDEISGVRSSLVCVPPNGTFYQPASTDEDRVFLILNGGGISSSGGIKNTLERQMMTHFPVGKSVEIIGGGIEGIAFLVLHLALRTADLADISSFDERCRQPYLKKLSEGERYGESFKSPQTISRTILPEGIVPRVAIGTVESRGPDTVGLHCHPMLEQYFLGLDGNDITVVTDGVRTRLGAFELLHIPLGSSHGVEVDEGCRLHYMWMDFFLDRHGQDWLKEHRPITP